MKQPSQNHRYAIGHDVVGNTFVAIKVGRHMDYIYGMFKGKELTGGHMDESRFDSWHKEGEQVAFEGHPTKGRIVLVMGKPRIGDVTEITGAEAEAIIEKLEASGESANAEVSDQRGAGSLD